MAVSFIDAAGVDRTANGGYSVLPENVIIKVELSGRSEETDVSELAEDIASRGQLVSAICRKDDKGWPVLVAGHRRYRAISQLNKDIKDPSKKIRLKFNYIAVKTEEEALDLTVAENRNRRESSAIDDSYNICIYISKFGKGFEEIAKKYFPGANTPEKLKIAVNWVKERQKLIELTPDAQDKLRKGEFSTTAAIQLAKLQPEEQNKLIKAKEKKGEKIKVADAKKAVEEVKPVKHRKEIAENSPVKVLERYKVLASLAGDLAAELLSDEPDTEVIRDFAEATLVRCRLLGVPLMNGYAEIADELQKKLQIED